MSPDGRKIVGFLLLALLAVPTGLCSMAVTPMAIGSFSAHDALERDLGTLALACSGIGFSRFAD